MSRQEPLFSIVIPTRNRASLLQHALKTALCQTFDDYEVVVMDNASEDHTGTVVRSFDSPRLRYFRGTAALSMPDNWEAAWDKARGRHVLYLSDDDALLPDALAYLADHVIAKGSALIAWDDCPYHYSDWIEAEKRNRLTIPVYPEDRRTEATGPLAARLYRLDDEKWFPRMLNTCVRKDVFDGIRRKLGRIFDAPCPDFSFCAISLQMLETMEVVLRPMMVLGISKLSIGASQSTDHGEPSKRFVEEFRGLPLFEGCPTDVPVIPNLIHATLLRANRRLSQAGAHSETVDETTYLAMSARALVVADTQFNPSLRYHRQKLLEAAERVSDTCAESVREAFAATKPSLGKRLKRAIGSMIQSNAFLRHLELIWKHGGDVSRSFRMFPIERGVSRYQRFLIVDCAKLGITNISEAAASVLDIYSRHEALMRLNTANAE